MRKILSNFKIFTEDTLTENKGECVICLEDLDKGNTIARYIIF